MYEKHTIEDLRIMQALPLDVKVRLTQTRIREWINYWGESRVAVSFSGGKDSTVLLHLVRDLYPNIKAVFSNTGLEYPEIQSFVRSFENVEIIHPKQNFVSAITEKGYPLISKEVSAIIRMARKYIECGDTSESAQHFMPYKQVLGLGEFSHRENILVNGVVEVGKKRYSKEKYKPLLDMDFRISEECCDITKKQPLHDWQSRTGHDRVMIGTLAEESALRTRGWLKTGCNSFNGRDAKSRPLSFWTEQDILQFIKVNDIEIASVYGEIVEITRHGVCSLQTTMCSRTSCIYCPMGAQFERGGTRFQRLKKTHPKQYDFCIGGGGYDKDGFWTPNKDGLGLHYVLDRLNKVYGYNYIKYE